MLAEETQKEAAKVKSATSLEARRINDKYLRLERGLLDPNLSVRSLPLQNAASIPSSSQFHTML